MSCDRFIWFRTRKPPTKAKLRWFLEDHFNGMGVSVEATSDRFFVNLPGNTYHTLTRLEPDSTPVRAMGDPHRRWIEVYMGRDNLDVITRFQDWVTNDLADGLARHLARYWEADELETE